MVVPRSKRVHVDSHPLLNRKEFSARLEPGGTDDITRVNYREDFHTFDIAYDRVVGRGSHLRCDFPWAVALWPATRRGV